MKCKITLSIALALSLALLSASASAQAPSCFPAPAPGCLYLPPNPLPLQPIAERETTYTDVAGKNRTIKFAIRSPIGLPAPLPVVIWSHGGNDGKSNPLNVGVEWSETLARRGYIVVSIAHEPRTNNQRDKLCETLFGAGYDLSTCILFKYLHWDRPFDISAVIDKLELMNAQQGGVFFGKFDLEQIAVAGHSAGSGGTLSIAGAKRNFNTLVPFTPEDQRPKVFMAFSPQQPGIEGFYDTDFKKPNHSWESINRPVLIATGDGDNLCLSDYPGTTYTPGDCKGQLPYGRRIPFERMPAGSKYRLYFHDAEIFHGLFDLNVSKCSQKNVNLARCVEFSRELSAVAFAFLDSNLKGIPFATAWLNSDNIELANVGVNEYSRK